MALPRSLRIGPMRYAVQVVKGLTSEDGTAKLLGYTNTIQTTIQLEPDQAADAMADTLLHEVLHACWAQTPLDGEIEESVIGTMTPILLDTLRRNPALRAALFGA